MHKLLEVTQIIISIILVLLILVQNKDEGFTAQGSSGSFKMTRRGPEKVIFISAGVFGILFLINAILFIFVQ